MRPRQHSGNEPPAAKNGFPFPLLRPQRRYEPCPSSHSSWRIHFPKNYAVSFATPTRHKQEQQRCSSCGAAVTLLLRAAGQYNPFQS